MSYEYYNPSSIDYIGRSAPEPPDWNGCMWQLICTVILVILLIMVYFG